MLRKISLISLIALLALFSCASLNSQKTAQQDAAQPEFNKMVLDTIKTYPTNGAHGYWWPRSGESGYSGCTQDLFLDEKKVMTGEPKKRTYCCGLTLEAFLVTYKKWLEPRGGDKASVVSPDDWATFQRLWFVEKTNGPGPSAACERYKLGKLITADEALPGDFVQLWRTPKAGKAPTGHSVIFLAWEKDASGKKTALKYWSTQPGTNGISERTESIGPDGGIALENTHFCRVEPKTKQMLQDSLKAQMKN